MKALLAVAVLVVGLGMFGLAAGFVASAVRRTRINEAGPPQPSPYAPEPPPAESPPTESPRGAWAGAGISTALGLGALVAAAVALLAIMAAPTRVLTAPAQAGGLTRDDSPTTRQLAARQREQLKAAGMPNPLTAVYHRVTGTAATVLFIGSSGHIDAPAARLRELLSGLAESAGTAGRQPTGFPAGRLKGTVMCLDQLVTGLATLTTCGWADEGSLGVITTDAGNAAQTAELLLSMRDDMEQKA